MIHDGESNCVTIAVSQFANITALFSHLLRLFGELNAEGLTLVVITHDEQVAELARRQVHIVDGRLTEVRR